MIKEVLSDKDVIKVYNSFLMTTYDMKSQEFDMFCVFLSQIQSSREKERDLEFHEYNVFIKDIEKKIKRRVDKKVFETLGKVVIIFDKKEYRLTEKCEVVGNKVVFKFHDDMKDFFIMHKLSDREFTTFSLAKVLKFRGVYSKRLYLMYEQFSSTLFFKVDFKGVCERFCIPESISKNFYIFRKKVIVVFGRQFNEICGLAKASAVINRSKSHSNHVESMSITCIKDIEVQIEESMKKRKKITKKPPLPLKPGTIALEKWLEEEKLKKEGVIEKEKHFTDFIRESLNHNR